MFFNRSDKSYAKCKASIYQGSYISSLLLACNLLILGFVFVFNQSFRLWIKKKRNCNVIHVKSFIQIIVLYLIVWIFMIELTTLVSNKLRTRSTLFWFTHSGTRGDKLKNWYTSNSLLFPHAFFRLIYYILL